jgi:hypothetical protein
MRSCSEWIASRSMTGVRRGSCRSGSVVRAVASAVFCLGLANSAKAGFSTVEPPLNGNNTQPAVLNGIYGGTFSLNGDADGLDYSNGSITAVRVADSLPSTGTVTDNPGPNATDQLWQDSSVTATVKESNAKLTSTPFGYIPGASGGTFTSLFNVTGAGFGATGSATFSPTGTFRFAAQNTYGVLSTLPSDNKDSLDHVITYEINGLGGTQKTWLLLFTDYGDNNVSDEYFDYQNLVVQLSATPSSSVPEPGSLMLLGGAGLALFRRLPRRSR